MAKQRHKRHVKPKRPTAKAARKAKRETLRLPAPASTTATASDESTIARVGFLPPTVTASNPITVTVTRGNASEVAKAKAAEAWKPRLVLPPQTIPALQPDGRALGDLLRMLSTCRPYDTGETDIFCETYLEPLGAKADARGNYLLRVGDSNIAYSSHTDTVHYQAGRQRLHYSPETGRLGLARYSRKRSACLGADCTAGVWLMREMILARVPGLYMFHAGEECGGIGSRYIANQTPEILNGIDAVIAFDRRGTRSVITHQWSGRCCSDEFGLSLARALGMGHVLDDGGSFTDSASYMGLVGECTNLAVGYDCEHTAQESLNVPYLFWLRSRLCGAFNTDSLVFKREAYEADDWRYDAADTRGANWPQGWRDTNLDDSGYAPSDPDSRERASYVRLIKDNPELVAALLEAYGITIDDAADFVYEGGGVIPKERFGY